ncbi:MAG: 3-oxoacyl-[acyl-carrier-protein] reductase [Acidobacteria bacterium]|nr:3-oxoacyl-[acyl-carrier-protein] reductase [Acidobacteriota bacterium]MBU4307960.1 3-oxoacyl-[acyl-carrier-protein] reductase [Acidobacteriota bacterium]MCG2811491.1 3-oxoacyl-[acyl-carrier-protein] reductase [Candidatus Aminicenantes bacterium]
MSDTALSAIVTGGARGIGKAIARRLAKEGMNIVISDIMGEEAVKTAREIEATGVRTLAVTTDVSKSHDAEELIKQTMAAFGSVDILVNNAGITRDNLSIRMGESDWDLVMSINLKGTFLCSQFAAKEMMKKRFGRIVNLASVSGILGTAGQANYAASKAGIIALSKSMARELGGRNITVNAVAPGFILTEMTKKLPENVKEAYITQIALKRAGTPEDVAEAVYFLASPAAQYITGTVLNVSGGLLI